MPDPKAVEPADSGELAHLHDIRLLAAAAMSATPGSPRHHRACERLCAAIRATTDRWGRPGWPPDDSLDFALGYPEAPSHE